MRSLVILLWDEFRGFLKSKVMLALWVGLPVLSIILHFIQPDADGIPVTVFTGLLIASFGGLLAAVMLSTTMVNELDKNVYDLFLIRPVKRWQIIIAKYIAVMTCLIIATLLSLSLGLAVDALSIGLPAREAIIETLKSLAMSVAAMSIASAAGILIGILVKSVGLAAILSIYLGQQLSMLAILPSVLQDSLPPGKLAEIAETFDFFWVAIILGVVLTTVIMITEIIVFRKKQF